MNLTVCRATWDLVSLKVGGAGHEAFLGATPYIISGDFAGQVNWCTKESAPLRSLQAFTGSTLALDVSLDGTLVAAGGWDAKPAVKIYDAATGTLKQTLPLKDGPASLTFSGDGKTLLVLDANRTYTWFDLANGKTLNTWTTPSQITSNLRGGGAHLFLEWSPGGLLRVYDAQKGRAKFSLRNYNLSGQTFTPDGQWIVTAGLNGILSSYNTQDGKPGPQVALGVVAGAGLMAGQSGAEVIALLQQNTEGQPSRILTSAWKVGENTLTPRGTANRLSGGWTVMNLAKTTPVSIALCRAP
ncbi:WD40 repeat domain-containing protein [Deinococcus sp. QL22]|uniref:WD40 repeat domain-containing protein n=1 Tax=Deinococcus sp. QL22 TaxID=2939437 RepID=UPI00201700FC|nr:hypothetical protein [Deinococcus sp. QL22]UQN10583.1 hypothetical protein M1R55_30765 [Deinococcus sp. QL22]